MKILDYNLFDNIEEMAKENPRRRMNHDLRTQAEETAVNGSRLMVNDEEWKDTSQRMLNVMMKDTVVPIHRHTETSETVIVLRGRGDEVTYDDDGHELERVTLAADSGCRAVQVPRNVYHTFVPHEDGTVIFEAKDRAYDPEGTEEFLFGTTEPRR